MLQSLEIPVTNWKVVKMDIFFGLTPSTSWLWCHFCVSRYIVQNGPL
jgi:hypothetical protein